MVDKEYLLLKLICNLFIVFVAIVAVCFLEYIAIHHNIDGVALSLSIGTIALISGVKGKEIVELFKSIFKRSK